MTFHLICERSSNNNEHLRGVSVTVAHHERRH